MIVLEGSISVIFFATHVLFAPLAKILHKMLRVLTVLHLIEPINGGKDIHISVTMPCLEVGTVGGGTQLASQSACLNLLGVKGASQGAPVANSRWLASTIAGSVLAGELSLLSAMAAHELVRVT